MTYVGCFLERSEALSPETGSNFRTWAAEPVAVAEQSEDAKSLESSSEEASEDGTRHFHEVGTFGLVHTLQASNDANQAMLLVAGLRRIRRRRTVRSLSTGTSLVKVANRIPGSVTLQSSSLCLVRGADHPDPQLKKHLSTGCQYKICYP